jgi:hypothetical protein
MGGAAGTADAGLPDSAAAPDAAFSPPPGAVSLFDGTSLSGWSGDPAIWSVKDGAIDGSTSRGGQLLVSSTDYDDFRLILWAKTVSTAQNLGEGVCFWGDRGGFAYNRCLLVVLPDGGMWDFFPNSKIGPSATVGVSEADKMQWHLVEILAKLQAGTVKVAVNGVQTLSYTDSNPGKRKKGPVGLQIHDGASELQYRGIFVEVAPKVDALVTVRK